MSVGTDLADVLDRISAASPQQVLLRVTVVAATVVFLVVVTVSGGEFHPVLSLLAVLVSLVVAMIPESHAPVGLLLFLGLLWVLTSSGDLDGWLLLATADLLVLHLACTLSAYGPSGHTLDAVLLRIWVGRAVACFAAGLVAFATATVVGFLELPGSGLVLGAALLVLLGWVGLMTVRLARPDAARDS